MIVNKDVVMFPTFT